MIASPSVSPRVAPRFDVLRLPIIGTFLRWRYARFVLQVPLLLIALLAVYDGFTGRQLAPRNTATVAVWVHYRGLVALAIAVAGNLFCAACPLMLTRGPTKFLKRFVPEFSFPKALKNKYGVLVLTGLFLFSYEHFDLWASPWLTAWLILAYFAAALLADTLFPAGTFCKYLCPLGNFNFALSTAAPTQITARDLNVCQSCEGKYCLNGREETATTRAPLMGNRSEHIFIELPMLTASSSTPSNSTSSSSTPSSQPVSSAPNSSMVTFTSSRATPKGSFPGCETDLFVPAIQSNQDCTLCFNCLRACPYDNVALAVRSPLREAETVRPKSDWTWFVLVLAWAGLINAFAMIPPYWSVAAWLSNTLQTRDEALLLILIQSVGIGAGVGLTLVLTRGKLREWIGVLFPLMLAIWGGHYLFHFITGYNTLIPNAVEALQRMGLAVSNVPVPGVMRGDNIFPVQAVVSYIALFGSLWVTYKKAARGGNSDPRGIALNMLPMIVLTLAFNALTLLIFSQPMQARGSLLQ
jgi:polyferredoxin